MSKMDSDDGESYVGVINYFMIKVNLILKYFMPVGAGLTRRKNDLIDPVHEFSPIRSIHTFPIDQDKSHLKMKCEELLYVSDTATESHYTLENPKNKGKTSSPQRCQL